MKFGYARVSTAEQNLSLQTDALAAAGVERIYEDTATGAHTFRPGLTELLTHIREGDTVVVWRLDRLARSLHDLLETAKTLEARGVQLVLLNEGIDTTTTTGKLFFQIFGAIAEFERNLIIERTSAGLAAARRKGRIGGRKPTLDADKQTAVKMMLADAREKGVTPSYTTIARAVGVSDRTVRRFAAGKYKSEVQSPKSKVQSKKPALG